LLRNKYKKSDYQINEPDICQIKYQEVGDEVKAYLAEIPTTCAFGKNKREAFVNLRMLLHGERKLIYGENDDHLEQ
jgi:hypothetical protein